MEVLRLIADCGLVMDLRIFKPEVQSMLAHNIERKSLLNLGYTKLYHVVNECAVSGPHQRGFWYGLGEESLGSILLPNDEFGDDGCCCWVLVLRIFQWLFFDGLEVVLKDEVGLIDSNFH